MPIGLLIAIMISTGATILIVVSGNLEFLFVPIIVFILLAKTSMKVDNWHFTRKGIKFEGEY